MLRCLAGCCAIQKPCRFERGGVCRYVEDNPDDQQEGASTALLEGDGAGPSSNEPAPRGHSPSGSSDSFEDISKEVGAYCFWE